MNQVTRGLESLQSVTFVRFQRWGKSSFCTLLLATNLAAVISVKAQDISAILDLSQGDIIGDTSHLNLPVGFERGIELTSWGWGLTNNIRFATGGSGGGPELIFDGKPQIQALTAIKAVDAASPKIYGSILRGEFIDDATLTMFDRIDGETKAVQQFELMGVVLVSASQGFSNGDEGAEEEIAFIFETVCVLTPNDAGSGGPANADRLVKRFCANTRTFEVREF